MILQYQSLDISEKSSENADIFEKKNNLNPIVRTIQINL